MNNKMYATLFSKCVKLDSDRAVEKCVESFLESLCAEEDEMDAFFLGFSNSAFCGEPRDVKPLFDADLEHWRQAGLRLGDDLVEGEIEDCFEDAEDDDA